MASQLLEPRNLLKMVYDVQSLRCLFLWALSRVAHAKDIATPEMLEAMEIEISPGELERIITTEEELQFTWEVCTKNPKEFCNQILLHSKSHLVTHKFILGAEAILITFTVAELLLTEYSMHKIDKQLGKTQTSLKKEIANILQYFDMACNWHSVSESSKINARSKLNNLILRKILPLSNEIAKMEGMAEERKKNKVMMMSLDGAMFVGSLLTFNGWGTFSNAKKILTGMFSGLLIGGVVVEGVQWLQLSALCEHLLHFSELLDDIRHLACYALDPQPGTLQEENAKNICNQLAKINLADKLEVERYTSPSNGRGRGNEDDSQGDEREQNEDDKVQEAHGAMWW